jgi:hypothetical protein
MPERVFVEQVDVDHVVEQSTGIEEGKSFMPDTDKLVDSLDLLVTVLADIWEPGGQPHLDAPLAALGEELQQAVPRLKVGAPCVAPRVLQTIAERAKETVLDDSVGTGRDQVGEGFNADGVIAAGDQLVQSLVPVGETAVRVMSGQPSGIPHGDGQGVLLLADGRHSGRILS